MVDGFDFDPSASKGDIGDDQMSLEEVYGLDERSDSGEVFGIENSTAEEPKHESELELVDWIKLRYPSFFRDLQAVRNHLVGENAIIADGAEAYEATLIDSPEGLDPRQKEAYYRICDEMESAYIPGRSNSAIRIAARRKAIEENPTISKLGVAAGAETPKQEESEMQEIIPDNIVSFINEIREHSLKKEYSLLNGMCARIASAGTSQEISLVEVESLLKLISRCLPPKSESS
jgi:hypothetical protein